MKTKILLLLSLLFLEKPAAAITVNFRWQSDASGLVFVNGASEPIHCAWGRFDVNVRPGENFDSSNLINQNFLRITFAQHNECLSDNANYVYHIKPNNNLSIVNGKARFNNVFGNTLFDFQIRGKINNDFSVSIIDFAFGQLLPRLPDNTIRFGCTIADCGNAEDPVASAFNIIYSDDAIFQINGENRQTIQNSFQARAIDDSPEVPEVPYDIPDYLLILFFLGVIINKSRRLSRQWLLGFTARCGKIWNL